jgi:hypothetical protein
MVAVYPVPELKLRLRHTPATLTVQLEEILSNTASVETVGTPAPEPSVSQLVEVPQFVFGAVLAENVIVASPVPLVLVRVPDAVGAPVPVQNKTVPAAIVSVTVNVNPLFIYVALAVAFAAVTVNLYVLPLQTGILQLT